jgi:hypothetical protein
MHSSPLMLISALGLAFMSFEATAETWPTKTRSSHLSGQFYGRGPARRVRAAFEAARPEDHRREPGGRRGEVRYLGELPTTEAATRKHLIPLKPHTNFGRRHCI